MTTIQAPEGCYLLNSRFDFLPKEADFFIVTRKCTYRGNTNPQRGISTFALKQQDLCKISQLFANMFSVADSSATHEIRVEEEPEVVLLVLSAALDPLQVQLSDWKNWETLCKASLLAVKWEVEQARNKLLYHMISLLADSDWKPTSTYGIGIDVFGVFTEAARQGPSSLSLLDSVLRLRYEDCDNPLRISTPCVGQDFTMELGLGRGSQVLDKFSSLIDDEVITRKPPSGKHRPRH